MLRLYLACVVLLFSVTNGQVKYCAKGTGFADGNTWMCLEFKQNSQLLTWNDAFTKCKNDGGWLVTVKNAQEQAIIKLGMDNNSPVDSNWFIGLNDKQSEGTWAWVEDGSQATYYSWYPGEPNSQGANEDCVEAYRRATTSPDDGKWNDIMCTENTNRYRYICQYPDFTPAPTPAPTLPPTPVPTAQPTGPTGQPTGQPTSNPTTSMPTSYMKRPCTASSVAFDCKEENSVCLGSECACAPRFYFDGAKSDKCVGSPAGFVPLTYTLFNSPEDPVRLSRLATSTDFRRIAYLAARVRDSSDNGVGPSIFISLDAGKTWTRKDSPATINQLTVAASDDFNSMVVGNYGGGNGGFLYSSTDMGDTWTRMEPVTRIWVYLVAPNGKISDLYAAIHGSGNNCIYKSEDKGSTWKEVFGLQKQLNLETSFSISDDGSLSIVVDFYGRMALYNKSTVTTADDGWKLLTVPDVKWYGVAVDKKFMRIAAVGTSVKGNLNREPQIYISENQGSTWRPTGVVGLWTDIKASASFDKLIAASRGATIFKYTQYGCTTSGYSNRPFNVQTATAGISIFTKCGAECLKRGYPYFGLECPMSSSTHCQCYSLDKLEGSTTWTTSANTPKNESCKHTKNHCSNTASLMYNGQEYQLGGSNVGSVYSSTDQGYSEEAGLYVSGDSGATWARKAELPILAGTEGGGTGLAACEPGTSARGLSYECLKCAKGSYADKKGMSDCVSCPAGKYGSKDGATSASECKPCAAGSFAGDSGMAACTPAPAGTYVPIAGSDAFTMCPAGRYSSAVGAAAVSTCVGCPLGKNVSSAGATICEFCPGGYFTASQGTAQCSACLGGTAAEYMSGQSEDDCHLCEAGKFSHPGSVACQQSPPGTFTLSGSAEPQPCPPGTYAEVGGGDFCRVCPISTYAPKPGSLECQVCPPGRITPEKGSVTEDQCVSPEGNFVTAIITFIVVVSLSYEYVLRGRFQLVGFLRRERVYKPLTNEALGLATYLYRYIYKAEAQRVYLTGARFLRVALFLIMGTLGAALFAFVAVLLCFARVIFKAMIVVVGLKMDLPFLDSIRNLATALVAAMDLPLFRELAELFVEVIAILAQFKIDLRLINLTCAGATAPLLLLTNVCIVGVIIIVVEAEFPFLNSVTVRTLTTKFYRIVVSINYIPWSPANFSKLRKTYFVDGKKKKKKKSAALAPLRACKSWLDSFFPPTAFMFSFHYIGVAFTSLASSFMQATDVFQTVLQYAASRVRLLPFIEVHGVSHAWDDNCNHIAGFPYFDTAMAVVTSIAAWLLLFPSLYCVSEILIPGIPSNSGPLEEDVHHKKGATAITKSYRDYYKVLSVIAPDLWWAELTSSWGRYIGRHTPYDTGKTSPSVHQVQRIAKLEDAATQGQDSLQRGLTGGRAGEGKRDALLPHILRSSQTVDIMQQLEAPDLHTFRVKVEVNHESASAAAAEIVEDDVELSHPKPVKSASHLRVRLFRCDRIISKTKVWTEIEVEREPENAGEGYFTLMKIEASTGDIVRVRHYGAWSLEYPEQTEMLTRDLRACTPNEVVLLVKWGSHEGHTSRLIEESILKSTKSEHFLSEEVTNAMHANTPSGVTRRKLKDPHLARLHHARAADAASGRQAASAPASPPPTGTLALPPGTVPSSPPPTGGYGSEVTAGEEDASGDDSEEDERTCAKGGAGGEETVSGGRDAASVLASNEKGKGKSKSGPGDPAPRSALKSVHHKVSTEERREFVEVMKSQALSGGSVALMELADAIAWVHGDSSTLPDSQAHFLIGLPVDAQMEELIDAHEGFTGGYMRWVSNSGMVFCKAHDLQDNITWKFPHLAEEGVLLDGVFSVGVVNAGGRRGESDKGGDKGPSEREKRDSPASAEEELDSSNTDDLKAVWRLEEDPSMGYQSMLCIPRDSYVLAPIRKRTDDENNAIHRRMLMHPPTYLRLCELEFAEMGAWPRLMLGQEGWTALSSCIPAFLASLIRYLGIALCVLGLGHPLTEVGRRAWYLVIWKYYRFMLLCFGYWSDDVVQLYQVHAKLAASSIVWMHPFFRITRSHEFDRTNPSEDGVLKTTPVRKPPPPPPPPPRASAISKTGTNLAEEEEQQEQEQEKEDGGESSDSEDSEENQPRERTPTVSLAQSTFRTLRYPRPTWEMLKEGKFKEWWAAAIHHGEETESSRRLQETTLKVLYANDYAAGLRSIVATRSVILQLVPGLALLSVFCELTSSFPLFVFSRQLELSLPEIINRDATRMARDIEREFTIAANHIRRTELNEDDNCVPDVELEHLSQYEIGVMQEANKRARNKMRMCLSQEPLKVKEWAVSLRSIMLTFEQSRLYMFSIEIFQFILILWLLFGAADSHKVLVALGLTVLFPVMVIKALIVYIGLGKALAITDADLLFFVSTIQVSIIKALGMLRNSSRRDEGNEGKNEGNTDDDDDDPARRRSMDFGKDSSGAAQPKLYEIYSGGEFPESSEPSMENPMHAPNTH